MLSQDDDGLQALVLGVIFCVVAVVLALVIGVGIQYSRQSHPGALVAPSVTAITTAAKDAVNVADAASAVQAALDAASIKVEFGVVKFYFASGKAELAPGAMDALAELVKIAKATGRTLVVSGFHDATGDAAKNAALAGERAMAVRDALRTAGVPLAQIELKKPAQIAVGAGAANGVAGGGDAEARRVEVALQ